MKLFSTQWVNMPDPEDDIAVLAMTVHQLKGSINEYKKWKMDNLEVYIPQRQGGSGVSRTRQCASGGRRKLVLSCLTKANETEINS